MSKALEKASKRLSLVLRHRPDLIGLTLNDGGWVGVDELLRKLGRHGWPLSRTDLLLVVSSNDKQRFAFSEDGLSIRASQGHSVDVDLGLAPACPPMLLYHGTAEKNVELLKVEGIKKMARTHVHLSDSYETALGVGARHGQPAVFYVNSDAMHTDGILFYRSDNGVWLTDEVPPKYLYRRS